MTIVDQNGTPFPQTGNKPITQEIATTLDGRDITRGFLDPLMPQMPDDPVLVERGGGDYRLYREVLRDDHVKAAVEQRRRAVISRAWEVKPGGTRAIDKAAANFLKDNLDAIGWDIICEKMLMGVFYGFAVGECLYRSDGRFWTLADIRVRDRRRFAFDGAMRFRMKTMQQPMGELMPDRKFWIFATGADHDDAPYGLGLAHWLYWPVWFKRNGHRFWAVFLEKYGTPSVKGTYPITADEDDQNKLLQALSALRRDSAVIIPEGMVVELIESKGTSTADHGKFIDAMNKAILVAAIGQAATTSGTPGRLGSEAEQGEVKLDIVRADADLLSASFNATAARWLTEWNFPGAAVPGVWRIIDEPEDLLLRSTRDGNIYAWGYQPTLGYVNDVYGGEWTVRPTATPAASVGGDPAAIPTAVAATIPNPNPTNTPSAFAEGDDPTPVTTLTDRLSADAAPAWSAILDRIRALVDTAPSLEALQKALLDAYGNLPTDALTQVMGTAFQVAALAGMSDASDGA